MFNTPFEGILVLCIIAGNCRGKSNFVERGSSKNLILLFSFQEFVYQAIDIQIGHELMKFSKGGN